ncbi:MAG: hypothetical protein NPMRTH1_820060 [Nitrosopumilales archaeon]|nr:MAG: hypothetical protein NPMRTH1_820060 [Nitrosopumilales archaeon]
MILHHCLHHLWILHYHCHHFITQIWVIHHGSHHSFHPLCCCLWIFSHQVCWTVSLFGNNITTCKSCKKYCNRYSNPDVLICHVFTMIFPLLYQGLKFRIGNDSSYQMLIKQVFGTEILSEIYCSSVFSNSSNSSFLLLGLIGTKMIVILLQIKPKEFSIRVFRTNGSQFVLLRFFMCSKCTVNANIIKHI